tara:strand:+ start:22897 stop:23826 length:930 start_codon:yes stop_codon:yes gene_type:complete
MNKILITGINGFIGQNLKEYLTSKLHQTIGISRNKKNGETISYQDLDKNTFSSSIAIVHLAGKAHDLKGINNDEEYYQANTQLTKTLFDQFLQSKCSVFIYMSSVKAAADRVAGILKEDTIPNPKTVYGKSKLAAEEYLNSKIVPKNKSVYILRPCMVHGPGNKGNLNLLYSLVSKKIPYPLGAFQNERSFVSIENLCFIINQLIEKRPKSGIYNISDDNTISTIELIQLISNTLNTKILILKIPKTLILFTAKIGTFLKLPFKEENIDKLTTNFIVSNTKIKSALQIHFPMSLEEGLSRTITSFNKKS